MHGGHWDRYGNRSDRMFGWPLRSVLALLVTASPASQAATVYRCVDAAGHITYTLQGCPPDQQQQLQRADNPTPGSGSRVPMATVKTRKAKASGSAGMGVVVVGERDDGCGNLLSDQARREAKLHRQVRQGMSRADIESAFGRPDDVTERNGQLTYRYRSEAGRLRQISFDEAGCVKARKR